MWPWGVLGYDLEKVCLEVDIESMTFTDVTMSKFFSFLLVNRLELVGL